MRRSRTHAALWTHPQVALAEAEAAGDPTLTKRKQAQNLTNADKRLSLQYQPGHT